MSIAASRKKSLEDQLQWFFREQSEGNGEEEIESRKEGERGRMWREGGGRRDSFLGVQVRTISCRNEIVWLGGLRAISPLDLLGSGLPRRNFQKFAELPKRNFSKIASPQSTSGA